MSKQEAQIVADAPASNPAPKRRGRPPGSKNQAAAATTTAAATAPVAAPAKRRGRKPGTKVASGNGNGHHAALPAPQDLPVSYMLNVLKFAAANGLSAPSA